MSHFACVYTGSFGGGQSLTLTGKGFDTMTNVTVCGELCVILSVPSATELICETPANQGTQQYTAVDAVN